MPTYYVEQDARRYRVESHSHKAAATRVAMRGGGIITVRDAHHCKKRYRLRMRGGDDKGKTPRLGDKDSIHIQEVNGPKRLTVQVSRNMTVSDVKKYIFQQWNIPQAQQKLTFSGNTLQDDTKLDDVQPFLQPGSTLHLIRLAAAAPPDVSVEVEVTVQRENDDKPTKTITVTVPRAATIRDVQDQALAALQEQIEQLEQLEKIVKIGDQTVAPERALGDDRELTLQLKSPAP